MTRPTHLGAWTYARIEKLTCTAHSSALHEQILPKFQRAPMHILKNLCSQPSIRSDQTTQIRKFIHLSTFLWDQIRQPKSTDSMLEFYAHSPALKQIRSDNTNHRFNSTFFRTPSIFFSPAWVDRSGMCRIIANSCLRSDHIRQPIKIF